jgi:hypothetical protein
MPVIYSPAPCGRIHIWLLGSLAPYLLLSGCLDQPPDGPHQVTGIKIGEVTQSSATIWTRLTRNTERAQSSIVRPPIRYLDPETGELVDPPPWPATPADLAPVVQLPDGISVEDLEGAAPGAMGEIQVLFRPEGADDWRSTGWQSIDAERDFTQQFQLSGLEPDTVYTIRTEGRRSGSEIASSSIDGRFRTAPPRDEPERVVFAAITGRWRTYLQNFSLGARPPDLAHRSAGFPRSESIPRWPTKNDVGRGSDGLVHGKRRSV